MKTILSTLAILITLSIAPARAATWNDAFGMGNPSDDWLITGSAQLNGTIANIRSNQFYWIGSARDGGVPVITGVSLLTQVPRPTIQVWIATNVSTITNISQTGIGAQTNNALFLEGTNMLAASDVCVYRHVATDTYQMIVLTNNTAGIYAAPVISYTSLTNLQAVGDKVYKMALVQTLQPTPWTTAVTNGFDGLLTVSNSFGLPNGIRIAGKLGLPLMILSPQTNTVATSALNLSGEYYVRPRR